MDILEHSRMVAELSDKIAEVNRRILDKTKRGEPADPADRLLLDQLTQQMKASSADEDEMAKAA